MERSDYERLEEFIKRDIPEINELKFGCRFLNKVANQNSIGTIIKEGKTVEIPDGGYTTFFVTYLENKEPRILEHAMKDRNGIVYKDFEIIGRDIVYADILYVLWGGKSLANEHTLSFWDFGKKTLEEQSEEFKEKLLKQLSYGKKITRVGD